MKILFLLLIFKLANYSDGLEDFKKLIAYKAFPFGIMCKQEDDYLGNEDEAQCVITKDGETLLNETSTWKNLMTKGKFETADESWNGANVSVLVRFGDKLDQDRSFLLTVEVIAPVEFDCSNVEKKTRSEVISTGAKERIHCYAPGEMRMSESQYNSITTVWYYGCTRIERDDPDFEYGKVNFVDEEYHAFEYLVIRNASLRTTPGRYHCILQRKNIQLIASSIQICICPDDNSKKNLPDVVARQEEYRVAPGGSINITCSGHTGTHCDSLSQSVIWTKYKNSEGKGRLMKMKRCFNILPTPFSSYSNCSSILHKKYCEPSSLVEENYKSDVDFTSTYTLRNVTDSDSGLYTCTLKTNRGRFHSNVTVVVTESLGSKTNKLTFALVAVVGCIFLVVVLILLFHIYKTPILYFLKRYFVTYGTMNEKYIAYLVYTSDVFNNMENNMLQDIYRYFGCLKNRVYDPNNDANQARALLTDSVTETLKQCKTAILFVTTQLLEIDNNHEIYELYQTLKNNIENLNMALVFMCTKQTKKNIIAKAGNGDKFCVMLRTFMQRRENAVILWKEENQTALNRALYVAMPKLKTRPSATTQTDTAI